MGLCLPAAGFTCGACSLTIQTGIKAGLIAIRRVSALAGNFLVKFRLNEGIPAFAFGGWFISPGQRHIIGSETRINF
jgi:hypothetical protein